LDSVFPRDGAGGVPAPVPQGMCTEAAVTMCGGVGGAAACEQTFCGGRLWRDGARSTTTYIPYRIDDPQGKFSAAYRDAIRLGAEAWASATGNLLTFTPCATCLGRFVSIVPGDGDGIVDPTALEQVVPMPVPAAGQASLPLHRIAHQWGHVIGLDDVYQRADRDPYVRFDPAVWCGAERPGLPVRCAVDPIHERGAPALPSGTFGVFDERSKMNGLPGEGVCSNRPPDADVGVPTAADASAALELYAGHLLGWSPLTPVGKPAWRDGRRDYQLAPGVDPVGTPAVAAWNPPVVEIFVRGSDDKLYTIHNEVNGTQLTGWSDWTPLGGDLDFDSDPSAVFVASDILYLVARSPVDGTIKLRAREAGMWGDWISLVGPLVGIASSPAIASATDDSLNVFVRGNDANVYSLPCTLPLPGLTGAVAPGEWQQLPPVNVIGKPAVSGRDGWLYVTAVGSDRSSWVIGGTSGDHRWGGWVPLPIDHISPLDPEPSVGLGGPDIRYFAPDVRGVLVSMSRWEATYLIGGLLASSAAAVQSRDTSRYDVVAEVDDHGRRGVWWKFNGGVAVDRVFVPPCNYNEPDTCAACGCNQPGTPRCDY
jgi:hypothetical protein